MEWRTGYKNTKQVTTSYDQPLMSANQYYQNSGPPPSAPDGNRGFGGGYQQGYGGGYQQGYGGPPPQQYGQQQPVYVQGQPQGRSGDGGNNLCCGLCLGCCAMLACEELCL